MDFGPEQSVHGGRWEQLHGGYFSDPAVAKPLVEAAGQAVAESQPDVIVDLGGGTGFLLLQLRTGRIAAATALVDLDGSEVQLAVAEKARIATVRGSVEDFRRAAVVPKGGRALFLMRSVLHYSGEVGLAPLLRHIRSQMEPGEFWLHQTACFEREEDAACLNALYRKMRTEKWYPVAADLRAQLEAAGWRVDSVLPAPTLSLESAELAMRYGLDEVEIQRIGAKMAFEFGADNLVLRLLPGGFRAELHYHIFICRAR